MTDFDNFVNTLTPEQREAFDKALNGAKEVVESNKKQEVPVEINDDFVVGEDFKVTRNKLEREDRRVRGGKNKWTDTGSNFGDERDLKTPDFVPTPRNRSKSKKIKVECHVCGKSFSVNPELVYGEFQRCNKCTGSK